MSFLEKFNNVASNVSGYIKFDDLEIGSYAIKHFAMLKKSTYGGKRLIAHIESGYLILPERMNEFAVATEIDRLNSGRYKLVYLGKEELKSKTKSKEKTKEKTKDKYFKINFRLEINDDEIESEPNESELQEDADDEEEADDQEEEEVAESLSKKPRKE